MSEINLEVFNNVLRLVIDRDNALVKIDRLQDELESCHGKAYSSNPMEASHAQQIEWLLKQRDRLQAELDAAKVTPPAAEPKAEWPTEDDTDFVECAECSEKPGMPVLCGPCAANRHIIFTLRKRCEELEGELKDGDSWQNRATEFLELGGCPICFSDDEGGHKAGCLWGECEAERDDLQTALGETMQQLAAAKADAEKSRKDAERFRRLQTAINTETPYDDAATAAEKEN